jgi:tetratricopeptide (TPR) repeat protein
LIRPETVEAAGQDINASLVIYGYVDTRQSPPELVLNFWIAPQLKYKFEDVQGNFQAGDPIRIVDINDPAVGVQGELGRQSRAIAWIAIGLAHEQLGQSEDALTAFLRAEESAPQSETIPFFIGREYLFLSDRHPDRRESDWKSAEAAFLRALDLNDQYARAYIGLGGVYLKRSAFMVDAALASGQEIDLEAAPLAEQAIAAYEQVLKLKPDPEQYGNPVEDVARLALGNSYRLQGVIAVSQGDTASALQSLDQAIQTLEAVQPVFEASAQEHESYRRYLAQTYEYLGAAYQWQGHAFELTMDFPRALAAYQKSLDAYNQCIAQAEITADLIIQNDIVGQRCQPSYEETKATFDDLNGEQ